MARQRDGSDGTTTGREPRDEWEPDFGTAAVVGGIWQSTLVMLQSSVVLKDLGVYRPPRIGVRPPPSGEPGRGPLFSRREYLPVLLQPGPDDELTETLDLIAMDYERYTRPYSAHIFEEALKVIGEYVRPSTRLLDVNSGSGGAAMAFAALVPEGEVVAADRSAEMVREAFEQARSAGIGNMAFFQADVVGLPADFADAFDVVFCPITFHRRPLLRTVAGELYRVVRPGGHAFVADATPEWWELVARAMRDWGATLSFSVPTPRQIEHDFLAAGFAHYAWEELLPGVGMSLVMK